MNKRLGTVLGHAAGCIICSVLVSGAVYALFLVRMTSEYEREGGSAGLLSTASHYALQVLVFLPGFLDGDHGLGSDAKVILTWISILFDGCLLYFLWSLARSRRRRRNGDGTPGGVGTPRRSAAP